MDGAGFQPTWWPGGWLLLHYRCGSKKAQWRGVKGVDQLINGSNSMYGGTVTTSSMYISEYVYIIFAIFVPELCDIYTAIFCIYTVTTLVGTWASSKSIIFYCNDAGSVCYCRSWIWQVGKPNNSWVKHEDVTRMLPYIVKWMLSGVLCGYLRFNWIGRIDLWWKDYFPGNQQIPSQGTFEDDIPCPKVGYVSPLESVPENVCSCWQSSKEARPQLSFWQFLCWDVGSCHHCKLKSLGLISHGSGQIIATSHDLTPNGGLVRDHPLISGKARLVKHYNLARWIMI